MSGELLTGELFTGVVNTGESFGSFVGSGLLGSPSSFRLRLWGIVKSICLWCLGYWYVPVIIVVCYCVVLFSYNWLWGYLLSKLQKKG